MSSEISLPWLVQNKPSAPIRRVENKVEFHERQFHSEKLSFVHKEEIFLPVVLRCARESSAKSGFVSPIVCE